VPALLPAAVSACEVDLSAGTSLAGLITHSSSLASLSLHNQQLHPLGLSCMALAAARSSSLTSLSLRGSAVGDQVRQTEGSDVSPPMSLSLAPAWGSTLVLSGSCNVI
jgi:hypothetical protein